jgi:hypothetical protein
VLISESVHPSVRGYLGVFPSIFLALGMLEAYLLGYLLPWRAMCWVLSLQPVLMAAALLGARESPYWLVTRGRLEEAAAALQWSRGPAYDIQPELGEIVRRGEEQGGAGGRGALLATLRSGPFLRGMAVSGGLFLLCQFTGIATLVVFMTTVFEVGRGSRPPPTGLRPHPGPSAGSRHHRIGQVGGGRQEGGRQGPPTGWPQPAAPPRP